MLPGKGVHACLRGEVRGEIRRCSPRRTGAGYPYEQPLVLFAHVWERDAVYPLCTEDVDIVKLRELLWRESFGWAEDHVAGIVDKNVKPAVLSDDLLDRGLDRALRGY